MTPFISNNKIYSLDISDDAKLFLDAELAKSPGITTAIFVNGFEEEVKERELIGKIMMALKLSADDYLLIDKAKYPRIRFRHLAPAGFSSIGKCLLFGINPSEMGMNVELQGYVFSRVGETRLLMCDKAHMLMERDILKRALWAELQKMYAE